jgi:hypothetical protein
VKKFDASIEVSSTSAAGPMVPRSMTTPALVSILCLSLGTSSAYATPSNIQIPLPLFAERPGVGPSIVIPQSAGAAIGELRRLSGFTWDQLARLFNVNRRSLHFWASGRAMAHGHEEQLHRTLGLLRQIDRGSASANRAALLTAQRNGVIPFDLLGAANYEQVLALLGPGKKRWIRPSTPSAAVADLPRPPEELVGALQDRIAPASGPLLTLEEMRSLRSK